MFIKNQKCKVEVREIGIEHSIYRYKMELLINNIKIGPDWRFETADELNLYTELIKANGENPELTFSISILNHCGLTDFMNIRYKITIYFDNNFSFCSDMDFHSIEDAKSFIKKLGIKDNE